MTPQLRKQILRTWEFHGRITRRSVAVLVALVLVAWIIVRFGDATSVYLAVPMRSAISLAAFDVVECVLPHVAEGGSGKRETETPYLGQADGAIFRQTIHRVVLMNKLVFCCDPCDPSSVDEAYRAEAEAAAANDFDQVTLM